VEAQVEAIAAVDTDLAELYRALGRRTLALARRKSPGLCFEDLTKVLAR
jgi:hypothetical protein